MTPFTEGSSDSLILGVVKSHGECHSKLNVK